MTDAIARGASSDAPATSRRQGVDPMGGQIEAPRAAFQGEAGAFSEAAARSFFGNVVVTVPCAAFRDVGRAVVAGAADYGVLPVENTLAGSVAPAYDVLTSGGLAVVGEIVCAIELCLMTRRGSSLAHVRKALSHPVALAQCSRFFQEHPTIEAVAVHDTAGAARLAAEAGDPAVAAVAGRAAADRYGLEVLATNLQDRPDNQTRFLIVARRDAATPAFHGAGRSRGGWKTVLSAETTNTPGALVALLRPFAEHGINLAHLECRPGETPWTYRFVLEVEADGDADNAHAALEAARAAAESFCVFGTFPRGDY